MSPRRRTDLALLLIIRRAERDAWLRHHLSAAHPDTGTALDPASAPENATAEHPTEVPFPVHPHNT